MSDGSRIEHESDGYDLRLVRVAWNTPFYTRMGFETLDPMNLPGPLAKRFRTEDADGLEATARVCMRYPCRNCSGACNRRIYVEE